jgi:hypothetical protein
MSSLAHPLRVVRVPITCCPECLRAYDLGEFRELAQLQSPDREFGDQVEREFRRCVCGNTLALITEGIEALDICVPEQEWRRLFPSSTRPAKRVGRVKAAAAVLRWMADRLGG